MTITRRRALVVAGLCAPAVAAAQSPEPAWFEDWAAVLRQHVDARGRVDFAGIAAAPRNLAAIVARIGEAAPRSPGEAARLAWRINAYNALAMYGIVLRGIPEALGLLGRYGFFSNTTIRVAGQDTSLKSFEDDVIRRMGEERVHFALNCMVRSCPRLPREPFRAARIEPQLAAAAREFCESPDHIRPDASQRTVFASQIFEFFTADFVPAKAPTLLAYVNRWRQRGLDSSWRLRFIAYDWTINRQPGLG